MLVTHTDKYPVYKIKCNGELIYSHSMISRCYQYNNLGINVLHSESNKFDVYDCLTNTKISEFTLEAHPFIGFDCRIIFISNTSFICSSGVYSTVMYI